jgi:choline kinase
VGGRTLLDHHLGALAAAGVDDVTIVTGFGSRHIVDHLAGRHRVIVNERFATTNSIVSLHLAAPFLRGHPFLFQNADVLYDPALVRRFVTFPRANACLVDGQAPWSVSEYHVEVDAGRIVRYRRDIPAQRAVAQSAQLVKVGAADCAAFLDRLEGRIAAGGDQGFPNQAYDVLMAGTGLWPVYTAGLRWLEVDTPEAYARCLETLEEPLPEAITADPITSRVASFLVEPRIPWRVRWLPLTAQALVRHPLRTSRHIAAFRAGQLSFEGLDLQANGAALLDLLTGECREAGLRAMLLWGSLLGCVRDGGFIWNDRDIDLGILESERDRLPRLRDAMVGRGFRIRIERETKLSLIHPRHPRLFLDLDVVHRSGTGGPPPTTLGRIGCFVMSSPGPCSMGYARHDSATGGPCSPRPTRKAFSRQSMGIGGRRRPSQTISTARSTSKSR